MEQVRGTSRSLLVAVDGSQLSAKACMWMLDNVFMKGDVVHAIHVVPLAGEETEPTWYGGFEGPILMAAHHDTVRDGMQLLKTSIEPLLAERAVHFKAHVLQQSSGAPGIAGAISEKARELEAHCIVVAHHRKSALQTWLQGSVTQELLRLTPGVPIIMIPDSLAAPSGSKVA